MHSPLCPGREMTQGAATAGLAPAAAWALARLHLGAWSALPLTYSTIVTMRMSPNRWLPTPGMGLPLGRYLMPLRLLLRLLHVIQLPLNTPHLQHGIHLVRRHCPGSILPYLPHPPEGTSRCPLKLLTIIPHFTYHCADLAGTAMPFSELIA